MTATSRQTVFAGLDQPGTWPPTPRALRPQRLELALDSLPGVAATTQRKLGKLGLATVRGARAAKARESRARARAGRARAPPATVRDRCRRDRHRRASPGRGGGRER